MKHNPELDIDGSGVTNGQRAGWVTEIMTTWAATHYSGGEDNATMVQDLISDLCHWLHSQGAELEDIEQTVQHAFGMFEEECTEPEPACAECARSHGPHYDGPCEH